MRSGLFHFLPHPFQLVSLTSVKLRMHGTIPPLSCIPSLYIYLHSIDPYMVDGQVDIELVNDNKIQIKYT